METAFPGGRAMLEQALKPKGYPTSSHSVALASISPAPINNIMFVLKSGGPFVQNTNLMFLTQISI